MQNIKLRKAMVLVNKVDGKTYVVSDVYADGTATAVEGMLCENGYAPVEGGKEVKIVPGKNDIAFRFIADPLPHEVPEGYEVENGILVKDGKPVTEQGEIVIDHIICCNPGNIILAVKPREEKAGYIDLFAYNLARDKFSKMIRATIPDVTYIGTHLDADLLAYSKTHIEKVKVDDKEEVEKEYFDAAAVIAVAGRKVVSSVITGYPFDQETAKIVPTGEHGYGIFFETDRKVCANGANEDIDEEGSFGEDLFDEGCDGNALKVEVEPCEKIIKGVARVMMVPTADGDLHVMMAPMTDEGKGEISYAPFIHSFVMNDGETITLAGKTFVKSHKAAEVAGMILVDVTEKDGVQILSFADKEAKAIKKIVVKHTADRGAVVTVE